MKKGKRILAAFLAVLMVVAIMPFTSFSGIFTSKQRAAESGKSTLLRVLNLKQQRQESIQMVRLLLQELMDILLFI